MWMSKKFGRLTKFGGTTLVSGVQTANKRNHETQALQPYNLLERLERGSPPSSSEE